MKVWTNHAAIAAAAIEDAAELAGTSNKYLGPDSDLALAQVWATNANTHAILALVQALTEADAPVGGMVTR